MEPPKSTDMQRPIQRVKFTKAIARPWQKSFARICLPRWTSSAQPQRSNIWGSVSGGDRVARARCPRSSVEADQKCIKIQEPRKSNILLTFWNRCLLASTLKPEEREFVVDSGASMHMISKKDLSDAEMDTLTKSCSPTIVITANGEVQTHEEATVYVKELDILDNEKSSKTLQQYCRSGSYAMNTGILMNGSMVKNHISLKTGFGFPVTKKTSFLLWFQACQIRLLDLIHQLRGHFQDKWVIAQHLLPDSSSSPPVSEIQTREREDRTESDITPVTVSTTVDERSRRPDIEKKKT